MDLLYFDGVENEEGETRPIFIPNACHVCKAMRHDSEANSEIKLLSCSGCRMIAYCGPAHQKEHWSQHKVFFAKVEHVGKVQLLFCCPGFVQSRSTNSSERGTSEPVQWGGKD